MPQNPPPPNDDAQADLQDCHDLLMNAPMPYQSLDEQGNFLEVNQSFLDLLGYAREELIGKNFKDVLEPGWVEHFKEISHRFAAFGTLFGTKFEMIKKNGARILVSFNGKIQRTQKGQFQKMLCIFQEITAQDNSEATLGESEELFKTLAEQCPISIMRFDKNCRVAFVNNWHIQVFGGKKLSKDFFLGKTVHELPGLVKSGINNTIARIFDGECVDIKEVYFDDSSGGWHGWVQIRGVPLFCKNIPCGGIVIREDITQRKQVEEQLRILATTDELTGLMNRRYFIQVLWQEFERIRRYGQLFSLIMMDIDHFKQINDEYGHCVGDRALRHFATILKNQLRQVDVPGRLGGEEFGALLPQTDLEGAFSMAERIREKVSQMELICNETNIRFTVSIGVAAYSPEVTSVDELLKRADDALYRAKNCGRNNTVRG